MSDLNKLTKAGLIEMIGTLEAEKAALVSGDTSALIAGYEAKIKDQDAIIAELSTANANAPKAGNDTVTIESVVYKSIAPKFHMKLEGAMKTVTIIDLQKNPELAAKAKELGYQVEVK